MYFSYLFPNIFFSAGIWSWWFSYEGVDAVDLLFFGGNFELADTFGEFVDLLIVFSNHFNQADKQLFD